MSGSLRLSEILKSLYLCLLRMSFPFLAVEPSPRDALSVVFSRGMLKLRLSESQPNRSALRSQISRLSRSRVMSQELVTIQVYFFGALSVKILGEEWSWLSQALAKLTRNS